MKRISGMQFRGSDLINQLNIEQLKDQSDQQESNSINKALLEPLQEYKLSSPLPKLLLEDNPTFLQVSENRVLNHLKLNINKASGPNEIPNWFLKEFADIITPPITEIINASFKEQMVPKFWKQANVTPIPKTKPIKDITKDLRPVSLTSCSK